MRLGSMARRGLTLLALTALVAMMVTMTRFSDNYSEPSFPVMVSQQKLYEYEERLKLIASEHNSNKTINNLLENLIHSKTELQSKIDSVNNGADPDDSQVVPNTESLMPPSNDNLKQDVHSFFNDQGDTLMSNKNTDVVSGADSHTNIMESLKAPATKKPVKIGSKPKRHSKLTSSTIFSTSTVNTPPKVDIDLDADQKTNQSNEKLQKLDKLEENEHKIIKVKPKLVFDREDLKWTESMKIDKPLGCDDDQGLGLDLLVIVNSAVDHIEARGAVRETWGRFALDRGAKLLFLIGSTTNSSLQQMIVTEDERNGDLLQGQFIDNYFNLTLKTISMMKWLSERCSKVKYVLKVDDDMFVNMQHITDFTETRYFNKCIIGKLAKKWKPHRNTNNKWYVPMDAYTGKLFPTFATGPAYIVSGDAVRPLYEWSIKLKPIYLEDVYMTGIVAEKAHIRRLNHGMITNVHIKDINACNFSKFMTSHKYTPQEIRRLWQLVYTTPEKPCEVPNSTPKPSKSAKKSMTQPKSKTVHSAG